MSMTMSNIKVYLKFYTQISTFYEKDDAFSRHLFCKLRNDIKLLNFIKMMETTDLPARQLISVIINVFFLNGL